MPLSVVVLPPPLVRFRQLVPTPRLGEVVVGHPALDIERRLDVGLVGLAPRDLLFLYAEGAVDGLGLVGPEDAAAVGDEPPRASTAA